MEWPYIALAAFYIVTISIALYTLWRALRGIE